MGFVLFFFGLNQGRGDGGVFFLVGGEGLGTTLC